MSTYGTGEYLFVQEPVASVYAEPTGKRTAIARLFFGEWLKVLDVQPSSGSINVRFRGGQGWIKQSSLGTGRGLEIFFLDVGQGDSILIQTKNDKRVLIDGGPGGEALDFIQNKYRLDKKDNYIDFEAVIATHSDADHTKGLISILNHPKIAVKAFYHNGLFPGAFSQQNGQAIGLIDDPRSAALSGLMKQLANALKIAERNIPNIVANTKELRHPITMPARGFVCERADASLTFIPPFNDPAKDIVIKVLWPCASPGSESKFYKCYGPRDEPGKTINGNSVSLRIEVGERSIFLSGDLNAAAMQDILNSKNELQPVDVYKAAHHGSQDYSLAFLQALKPNAAVVSSGDDKNSQYGHPRAIFLGTVVRYSSAKEPAVFSTELARCYKPLTGSERNSFMRDGKMLDSRALETKTNKHGDLYAKSLAGTVHLRSDGTRLLLGRVYGAELQTDVNANTLGKWDYWEMPQH